MKDLQQKLQVAQDIVRECVALTYAMEHTPYNEALRVKLKASDKELGEAFSMSKVVSTW